jgi:hypothetical protein
VFLDIQIVERRDGVARGESVEHGILSLCWHTDVVVLHRVSCVSGGEPWPPGGKAGTNREFDFHISITNLLGESNAVDAKEQDE